MFLVVCQDPAVVYNRITMLNITELCFQGQIHQIYIQDY